jgi:hypothetical protein
MDADLGVAMRLISRSGSGSCGLDGGTPLATLLLSTASSCARCRSAGRDGGVASQALRCFLPLDLAAARAAARSRACATKKLVFVAAAARRRA